MYGFACPLFVRNYETALRVWVLVFEPNNHRQVWICVNLIYHDINIIYEFII